MMGHHLRVAQKAFGSRFGILALAAQTQASQRAVSTLLAEPLDLNKWRTNRYGVYGPVQTQCTVSGVMLWVKLNKGLDVGLILPVWFAGFRETGAGEE